MSSGSLEQRHLVHFINTDELNSIDVGQGVAAVVRKILILSAVLRSSSRAVQVCSNAARVQSCPASAILKPRTQPVKAATQTHRST